MPQEESPFARQELLLGKAACDRLAKARVLLVGTGGVGSWLGETLVRAGIGHLTMMDPDTVHSSNLNRQLCALHSTIGREKVAVLAERFRDISPALDCTPICRRLVPEEIPALLESRPWDCVADAIDDRQAKCALLQECLARHIPVVSSMGAANKRDIRQITSSDLSRTYGDPLAKSIRKNLHKQGCDKGIHTIFSPELPDSISPLSQEPPEEIPEMRPGEKRPLGTICYMPAAFGLHAAAEILQILLNSR